MSKIKNKHNTKSYQHVKQLELSYVFRRNEKWYSHFEKKKLVIPCKVKDTLAYNQQSLPSYFP